MSFYSVFYICVLHINVVKFVCNYGEAVLDFEAISFTLVFGCSIDFLSYYKSQTK